MNRIKTLDRESLRDPSRLLTPAESSNIPGQVLLMLTVARLYRGTSPNAPTREIMRKRYQDKAKKGEMRNGSLFK